MKRISKGLICGGLMMTMATACQKSTFTQSDLAAVTTPEQQEAMDEVNDGKVEKADRPYCEVDPTQFVISPEILAFEMTNSSNINVGFNLLKGFLRALGLSFQTRSGEMNLSVVMKEFLNPHFQYLNSAGTAKAEEKDFKASIDALQLGTSFGYYSKTPIAKLTEKGLRSGLTNLQNQLKNQNLTWWTMVAAAPDLDTVVLPTGAVAGLKVGDQVDIYEVEHLWASEPCSSEHYLTRKLSDQPLVTGVILQTSQFASLVDVSSGHLKEKIELGSYVYISASTLKKPENKDRQFKWSVKLQDVVSQPLQIDQTNHVQLGTFATKQLRTFFSDFNFVSR